MSRKKSSRKENTREVRPRFLIVCEDGKSAPSYFSGFRLTSAIVLSVGTGMNTLSLVEEAIRLREKHGVRGGNDQTWVVMDRDAFPQSNYDNAFAKADANNILVAYSNECVEVWFLMHFTSSAKIVPRHKLPGELTKFFKVKYSKGMKGIFKMLDRHRPTALENAKKIRASHKGCGMDLHHCRPITAVDTLVLELQKHIR